MLLLQMIVWRKLFCCLWSPETVFSALCNQLDSNNVFSDKKTDRKSIKIRGVFNITSLNHEICLCPPCTLSDKSQNSVWHAQWRQNSLVISITRSLFHTHLLNLLSKSLVRLLDGWFIRSDHILLQLFVMPLLWKSCFSSHLINLTQSGKCNVLKQGLQELSCKQED